EVVKGGADLGMRGEIIPERAAKDFVVGRLAGPDGAQETAPGVRHASTEAVEIESEQGSGFEQRACGVVEREGAALRLCKDALRDEVPEETVEEIGVGSGGGREVRDAGGAGLEVVRDAEGRGDVDAPRSAEVTEFPDVHGLLVRRAHETTIATGIERG